MERLKPLPVECVAAQPRSLRPSLYLFAGAAQGGDLASTPGLMALASLLISSA